MTEGRPVSAAVKNSAGPLPLELLRAAKYRPYLAPALVSTTGLPRRVGGRIARRIAALSRREISAAWCGSSAVTGGD